MLSPLLGGSVITKSILQKLSIYFDTSPLIIFTFLILLFNKLSLAFKQAYVLIAIHVTLITYSLIHIPQRPVPLYKSRALFIFLS